MAGPICLPHIETLCVEFTLVDHKTVDLSWLHEQPADHLCLTITVRSVSSGQQLRLVKQLQLLSIHYLSIKLEVAVSERVQRRWARLAPVNNFLLVFPPAEMHISELPQSNCAEIRGSSPGTDLPSVSISWSAVCTSMDRTCISPRLYGSPCQLIHIIGCPGDAPDRDQPWELEFSQPESLVGLPEALFGLTADEHGMYRLQNAAALRQSCSTGSLRG